MFEDITSLVSATIVFLFGLALLMPLSNKLCISPKRAIVIYFWHTVFCVVYFLYVIEFGGDANYYYEQGLLGVVDLSRPGTKFVYSFTTFLVHGLFLNKFGCFLFFNALGSFGLIILYASLYSVTRNKSKFVRWLTLGVVFLPSVSYWSAGLGKDAVAFLAVCIALWASLAFKKRIVLMAFAILLMFLVRPHIAGFMILSITVSTIFQKSTPILHRIFFFITSLSIISILIPFALDYAGFGGKINAEDIDSYITQRSNYNTQGGGGLDLSSMNFFMKLFTYMFRPLPFEVHSISSLMASIDNTFFLILSIFGFIAMIKNKLSIENKLFNRGFVIYYLLGTWCILAITTANLGIAVRQKWMVAPMLLILIFSAFSNRKY